MTDDEIEAGKDGGAVDRLLRFWREVDGANGSWVHPADGAVLAMPSLRDLVRWDAPPTQADVIIEHRRQPARLQASLIPQPYLGNLARADVVLCVLNPDLDPGSWLAERDGTLARQRKLAGLRQEGVASAPFWAVDPNLADTVAFRAWWPRFVAIAELLAGDGWTFEEAIADLSHRVACVAFVPYAMRGRDPISASLSAALPSAQLASAAVREKAAKGAQVILLGNHADVGLIDDGDKIRQAEPLEASNGMGRTTICGQLIRRRMNPDPTLLVPFTAMLANGGFSTGEWQGGIAKDGVAQFPWFARSDELQALAEAIYAGRWVLPGFSWPNWFDSGEARCLRDEAGAVETANIRQLGKLLTTIVRADRFSEGTLAQTVESGLMLRIVRRADELASTDGGNLSEGR